MAIKAVIWDIGGVLARTVDRGPRTRLAERFGLSYNQLEALIWGGERGLMAQKGQLSADEQWRWACTQLGLPEAQASALRQEFFAGDILDQDLLDYIRHLHQDYKTGIISNAMSDTRTVFKSEFAGVFDHMVFSAEVGMMKPVARIFELALDGLGIQAGEAVFIDDFLENVHAAQAIGLHAIHFQNPVQVKVELAVLLNGSSSG